MSATPQDKSNDPPEERGKAPRTARGRQTHRRLLDAAAAEFGEKGFYDASISGITARAGTALGSFYTYFASKEAIFIELVGDISGRVTDEARAAMRPADSAVEREGHAFEGFLRFARANKEIYRIIDQAEFVDAEAWRGHYLRHAQNIARRLEAGTARGEFRDGDNELRAWAIMGMNVFLGLRYGVWSDEADPADVAAAAGDLLANGLLAR